MRLISRAFAAIAFLLISGSFCAVSADDCPCGSVANPLWIQKLTPQEAFGADFRPACRGHDSCYGKTGASRRACDRRFLKDLQCSCKNSTHPILCRTVARVMYVSVRVGGMKPFRVAQGWRQ